MRNSKPTHIGNTVILAMTVVVVVSTSLCCAQDKASSSKYLNAVREFADNVLKYGRDTYGPKHTPLFVDGLNIHTHEPVKWIAPNGDRWILSNLASQQNLFRVLDGLTTITGDPKYKRAAMEAIEYAFENLRSPSGLLHWGGHQAYDVGTENPCGRWVHENKGFYPHYELMWEVNPTATKQPYTGLVEPGYGSTLLSDEPDSAGGLETRIHGWPCVLSRCICVIHGHSGCSRSRCRCTQQALR
jgi:hypothetical protein